MKANNSIVGANQGKREKDDFYPTPSYVTEALLKVEKFEGNILEPACGDGAMSKVLELNGHNVISTDLIYRNYGIGNMDFLLQGENMKYDNVITNPPFKFSRQFIEKALKITSKKVAIFNKLVLLESEDRYNMFQTTPLKNIYVFSKRVALFPKGKGKGAGQICFAWFVWEHGYEGKPQVNWILNQ